MEKLSSMKSISGAGKVGDRYSSGFISESKWKALWVFWEWDRQMSCSVANTNNVFLNNYTKGELWCRLARLAIFIFLKAAQKAQEAGHVRKGCSGNAELTHLFSITDNETRKDFMNTDQVQRRLLKCSGSQKVTYKKQSPNSEGLTTENKAYKYWIWKYEWGETIQNALTKL